MRLPIHALVLLLSFLWCVCEPAAAAPTIQFEKTVFDFGRLLESEKTKVEFPFKNTGDAVLEITSVTASCGCTEAKATSTKVAPGGSAVIEATLDSTGFKEKISKDITVETNDPAHPEVVLQITGEVLPIAMATPEQINFGTLKVGTTKSVSVVVSPSDPDSFRILRVEGVTKQVTVPEFRRARDGKGTYYLRVLVTAGSKPGRVMEQLKIVTGLPGNLSVGLMVYGNISEQAPPNEKPS